MERFTPLGGWKLWAVVAALLAVVAIVVLLADPDDPDKPSTVTVHVDGADPDRKRDDKIELSEKAQEVLKDTEEAEQAPGEEGTEPDPDPADVAHPDVAPDTSEELRGKDRQPAGVLPQGGASQGFPGCQTRFVGSYSARTRSVKGIGLHYTAGPNSPGLADMNGLTAYSNRNQVSWHFLIDREGHCYYSVPLTGKAWTIGNLNSETTNIEVVGRGNEPGYAGSAGMAKLAQVVREIGRRQGIPMRLGATDGRCNMTRRGIITHWMGGGCSGGHHDIRPYLIQTVIAQVRAGGGPTSRLTKREARIASKRCYHRREHLAGRKKAANLKWARHYKRRIRDLMSAIDRAKRRDGKPWSYRHRGSRRAELASKYTGKGC